MPPPTPLDGTSEPGRAPQSQPILSVPGRRPHTRLLSPPRECVTNVCGAAAGAGSGQGPGFGQVRAPFPRGSERWGQGPCAGALGTGLSSSPTPSPHPHRYHQLLNPTHTHTGSERAGWGLWRAPVWALAGPRSTREAANPIRVREMPGDISRQGTRKGSSSPVTPDPSC